MTTFFSGLVLACALLGARGIHAKELPLAPVQLSVLSARGFLAAMQSVAPAYEEATGGYIRLQEAPPWGGRRRQYPIGSRAGYRHCWLDSRQCAEDDVVLSRDYQPQRSSIRIRSASEIPGVSTRSRRD